ncbi:MAG: NAD-dependent epimerase/dehydratase family protein, partial [Proteobacteria bacterium]
MHNRKAIITGVTGQDGSYLADQLVAKGYSVLGLTRDPSVEFKGNVAHLKGLIDLAHCSYDQQSIAGLIESFDPHEIYNLAGQSFVSRSWEFQQETLESAGLVPCYFLEAIAKHNPLIRFFQASSSEIFQPAPNQEPLTELSPIQPVNPYGCAKGLAHNMVAAYRNNKKLFAVNGILFNHESE